jgi:hypothetical protein
MFAFLGFKKLSSQPAPSYVAGIFWSIILRRVLHNVAFVGPGFIVYATKEAAQDESVRKHELQHLVQQAREGQWRFWIKYVYWLFRRGYWNHPYEVDARAAEVSPRGQSPDLWLQGKTEVLLQVQEGPYDG